MATGAGQNKTPHCPTFEGRKTVWGRQLETTLTNITLPGKINCFPLWSVSEDLAVFCVPPVGPQIDGTGGDVEFCGTLGGVDFETTVGSSG